MQSYLHVCLKCGYDTAAYGILGKCPICRAGREKLKIMAMSDEKAYTPPLKKPVGNVTDITRKLGS